MKVSCINSYLLSNAYKRDLFLNNPCVDYNYEIKNINQSDEPDHSVKDMVRVKDAASNNIFQKLKFMNFTDIKAMSLFLEDECVKIIANFYSNHIHDRGANEYEVFAYYMLEKYWSNDPVTKIFLDGVRYSIPEKFNKENLPILDRLPHIQEFFRNSDKERPGFGENYGYSYGEESENMMLTMHL